MSCALQCCVEEAAVEIYSSSSLQQRKTPNALLASPHGQLQSKLKEKKEAKFSLPFDGLALHRCITNESGQKAESEQQKICLHRASSVMVLMRSRGSTSAQFDPPACGHGAASSATLGHLGPELLCWTNSPKSSSQQPPGNMKMLWKC